MKFHAATEHTIRILQHLHRQQGVTQTAMEIVLALDMKYPFFMSVTSNLTKAGLIKTTQGRNGGYSLGKPVHEISVYDVFRAVEGDLQLRDCLQENVRCIGGDINDCKLRTFLYKLQKKMIAEMSAKTIVELRSSSDKYDEDKRETGSDENIAS